jgi:hypothetical protein
MLRLENSPFVSLLIRVLMDSLVCWWLKMGKWHLRNIEMCFKVFLAPISTKFKIGKGKKNVYRKRKNILVLVWKYNALLEVFSCILSMWCTVVAYMTNNWTVTFILLLLLLLLLQCHKLGLFNVYQLWSFVIILSMTSEVLLHFSLLVYTLLNHSHTNLGFQISMVFCLCSVCCI